MILLTYFAMHNYYGRDNERVKSHQSTWYALRMSLSTKTFSKRNKSPILKLHMASPGEGPPLQAVGLPCIPLIIPLVHNT